MLINCPYCGPRDVSEFTYQGDANRARPTLGVDDPAAWSAYVYDRVNTAGLHREYWQHSGGCRCHVVTVRDTVTHEVSSVTDARNDSPSRPAARRSPRKPA